MAEVKRRSKEEIAKDKAEKEARRIARAAEQARREEAAAAVRAEMAKRDHDARLEHERRRAQQRMFQEAGIEFIMGYDTPAARLFARFVQDQNASVREAQRRKQLAGDPLNLTGHTKKPSEKQEQKLAEKERLARGERKIIIPDPDSPRQNVMVTTLPHSFRRVKLQIHQEPAAERFVADWESAGYSGLSSPGFDPKVDSSAKETMGHMRAAEAQKRLKMAEVQIGQRNYDICVGVLINNANASRIHALGGRDHRTVSHDIDVALNALAGFYDPVRLERDPTWRAFQQVIEAGKAVIKKLEDDVR
jgi:hypothetical protein